MGSLYTGFDDMSSTNLPTIYEDRSGVGMVFEDDEDGFFLISDATINIVSICEEN